MLDLNDIGNLSRSHEATPGEMTKRDGLVRTAPGSVSAGPQPKPSNLSDSRGDLVEPLTHNPVVREVLHLHSYISHIRGKMFKCFL